MPFSEKFSEPISSLSAGNPKSSTAGMPRPNGRVSISAVQHLVNREMKDPRHRADFALHTGAVDHEERLNQVRRRQLVLAHQLAQGRRPAAAAGSSRLEGGSRR